MKKIILFCACVLFLASCGNTPVTTDASTPLAGSDGNNALVFVSPEIAGTHCPYAGQKIETGLDTNVNGTLDESEITNTSYICNGANGAAVHDALVFTSTAEPGNCNGLGGVKVQTTIDFDDDSDASSVTLDNSLEQSNLNIFYVCNNISHNALVTFATEFQGSNCPFGGQKIRYGIDANGNGSFELSEATNVIYVCSVLI